MDTSLSNETMLRQNVETTGFSSMPDVQWEIAAPVLFLISLSESCWVKN